MAKISISLPDDVLARVDSFCERTFQNRSSFICQSVLQTMNSQEAVVALVSLSSSMRKIAETGSIDEETKKELDEIQRVAEFLQLVSPGQ